MRFQMNISTLTAQNSNLFEIDAELEAAFDQMQEEREITGNISDETRERCVQLFAELGKKIDRIAAYLRHSSAKPALPPRKDSGYNNAAGQPSSASVT